VIRPETPADQDEIRDVTRRAFAGRSHSGGNEQDIVDALRIRAALAISLVADWNGRIVGHVAFSAASPADGSAGWYTLGPVSVAPEVQRRGIGTALITAGIAKLREEGASGCIVVGDTNYYPRFGFVRAPQLAPVDDLREHFMILCLHSQMPQCIIDFHACFK
jgi:putative acetyltransferase